MKDEFETQLEATVRGRIDSFLLDPQGETNITQLEKSLRAVREGAVLDHEWAAFVEDMELAASSGGRSGHAPRLRSERPPIDPDEIVWRPGMDPNIGLGEPFEKSASRKMNSLRTWLAEKLASGTSADELIRHAQLGGDPETADALRQLAEEMGAA